MDRECTWLSDAGVYVSHEHNARALSSMRNAMKPQHTSSDRPLVVRNAAKALRLARSGSGPILAFLSDWDAVDTLRAIAAGSGLETRLAVHHHSAAMLTTHHTHERPASSH